MVSKTKTKSFVDLDVRSSMIRREVTVIDPLDAGKETVIKMIEDGLDALGENVGRVILHHLEVRYSLKRNQISRKLDVFTRALRELFGEGSLTIERIIVETINRKTGISMDETETRTLSEAIEHLRAHWPRTVGSLTKDQDKPLFS